MNMLLIINDAPYGTEKAYNALRTAMALQQNHGEIEVRVFLLADAVGCALPDQKTPQGYYNIGRMLRSVIAKGGKVKACGGCSEARGIAGLELLEGVELSNMAEFSQWLVEADRVVSF